jgi:hypothetical protein
LKIVHSWRAKPLIAFNYTHTPISAIDYSSIGRYRRKLGHARAGRFQDVRSLRGSTFVFAVLGSLFASLRPFFRGTGKLLLIPVVRINSARSGKERISSANCQVRNTIAIAAAVGA